MTRDDVRDYLTRMDKLQTKESISYVRFDDETMDRLRQISHTQDRPISAVIRKAVEQYLRRMAA